MKNLNFTILSLLLIFYAEGLMSQESPREKGLEAITKEAVQGQLEFLASDWTQGRATGMPGEYIAADFIASIFKIYGLQPGGDIEEKELSRREMMQDKRPGKYRSYFQNIEFVEYSVGEDNEFYFISGPGMVEYTFNYKTDYLVEPSEVGTEIEAPVVFTGYGYENKENGYDDFKGVDVKNKIILRLTGYPGHSDTTSKAYKILNKDDEISPWRLEDEKNKLAKEKGVLAIIEINPGYDPLKDWATNIPFRYNQRMYEGDKAPSAFYNARMAIPGDTLSVDPVMLYISSRVLNELLSGSRINISQFEQEVKNVLKPASKEITGKKVHIKTTVNSRIVKARNVIGVIPGKDTNNCVIIGGHYDHLGIYNGIIWNGADDNASGTVGVMTIAKAFMASGLKPEKTIIFCAWTGEEKGLLGSEYYVDHLPVPPKNISMYLNYDMISRDDEDDTLGIKCRFMYTEGYKSFEDNTRKFNDDYNFGLDITYKSSARPRGGSDHTPFAEKNIPIIYYMAGFPIEYHQADDHVRLVNWDKMVKIIKLGYLNVWDAVYGEVRKEEK